MSAGDWIIVGGSLFVLFGFAAMRLSGEADDSSDDLLRRIQAGEDVRLAAVIRDAEQAAPRFKCGHIAHDNLGDSV